jgi:dolichyl-phosphate beta-glucosyltransferase
MYLSVVIQAYNEEQRIAKTLHTMHGYLQQQRYAAEITMVDDGSQDGTASIVGAYDGWLPAISVLQNGRNRGNGVDDA